MTARCTTRACPVVFRSGEDRPCPWCRADDTNVNLTTRANGFSVSMTAFDGGGSGHGGDGDGDGDGDGGQAADRRQAGGQARNRHGIALR